MESRRGLLKRLAAGAIPRFASDALSLAPGDLPQNNSSSDCSRPLTGPHSGHFPNVVVYTHDGRKALFYDDLLRGKMVMINCMSIKNENSFPVTRNLARVQRLLGNRLGRDLFMYSITVDPEHDTPKALAAFAEKHQAGPGWMFLTGERAVLELLRSRLFMNPDHHDHEHGPVEDCSMALIRYGNEAVGVWGSVPAKKDPVQIATRLSWIESGQPAAVKVTRGGPMPLSAVRSLSQDRR